MHKKIAHIVLMTFIGISIAAAVAFVFGFFVMLLWNWLMPTIFGLSAITYWQAWGLVILGKLLFCGPGHHHPPFHASNDCGHHHHPKIKDKIHRWINEKDDNNE